MSQKNKKIPNKDHFLHSILNPKSIAIFGANNNLLTTMGSMQLRNIRAGKGLDDNIFPIHPRLESVQGYKAYKSIMDLPIIPEMAFLILPTTVVPEVMEQCGQKGIKHLLITSGGFRESGSEGIKLSKKIDEIAKKYGIRFIGPNCLGIYNGWYGYPEKENAFFNTFWPYAIPQRGNVSIVSQSGTIAAQTFWHAKEYGVKISKSLSVGNERNIDMVDCLEYLKNDPQTDVIGLYIEEIKRGKQFIKIAKEITKTKPIVAIYAGGTKAAIRSIKSHTGSIAGSQKVFKAVFRETGIIQTDLILEFLYYLRAFSFAKEYNVFPKGKRVAIVTDSGGSGSMMAKTAELYGLEVPEFSDGLNAEISDLIPSTASANNPIDVTFDVNFMNLFYKFPKILMKSNEVDSIIVYGVFDFDEVIDTMEKSGMIISEEMKTMNEMIDNAVLRPIKRLMKKYSIPVFYAGPFPYKYPWYQKFISYDVPIFELWDYPTKCLSVLSKYVDYRNKLK
ncbi:MAG: acetate--CoA ligase family protein [Promethearchaeota archaeon]